MSMVFYPCGMVRTLHCDDKLANVQGTIDSMVEKTMKVFYIHNSDKEYAYGTVPGSVGTKTWTVIHESNDSETLSALVTKVDKMQRQLDAVGSIVVITYIRNTSAQVLLFLIGQQPKPLIISKRFANSRGTVRDTIDKCANDIGLTSARFIDIGDSILNRRNYDVHSISIQELIETVKNSVDMIDLFPSLNKDCKNEVKIIEEFDVIRKRFPSDRGSNS